MIFIGLILSSAFLLELPQLLGRELIIGSDAIFHYNRFYDTAQQIKNSNWQYFISMYGFEQSGRIVNAMYGPLMAYFQGLLVLISPSWFGYQVLSNFLVMSISGLSLGYLLKKADVALWPRVFCSVVYMASFSLQYWVYRQGFSSWGAALLPLCLVPLIQLVNERKISPWKVGLGVALMVQIHLLTSLFLIMIYVIFFLVIFFKSSLAEKKGLLKDGVLAVVVFIPFTLNIWLAFWQVYGHNQLLPPFINRHIEQNTIDGKSSYWLTSSYVLMGLIGISFFSALMCWKKLDLLTKLSLASSAIFFLLSTQLLPWHQWVADQVRFAQLIQFPFRFYIPFSVLLLLGFGLLSKQVPLKRYVKVCMLAAAIFSICQTNVNTTIHLQKWDDTQKSIFNRKHTFVYDEAKVKKAMYSSNLQIFLNDAVKSTPDYLPQYREDQHNKYRLYEKEIINNQAGFTKRVVDDQLLVEWQKTTADMIQLPLIKYHDTKVQLNGRILDEKEMKVSTIGTLSVPQEAGMNMLILTYETPIWINAGILLTVLLWLGTIIYLIGKKIYQRRIS